MRDAARPASIEEVMPLLDPRVFGAAPTGLRRERIHASPRFRDGRFENTVPVRSAMAGRPLGERLALVGEFAFGGKKRRPPAPLAVEDPRPGWLAPPETGLRSTWLGHSTVLLEIDGTTVLTDPVWGERVSPMSFAGPRRFHPPPVSILGLPRVDAVLVSHDHFDHLDHPTIRALAARDATFVTSLGVGAHLEAWGVPAKRIVELDWWEQTRVRSVTFTAAPSRHFSGRGVSANATAWSSFAMRGDRHRVFFSGDTGLTPEFEEVGERLGPFDLVMLEVGAYHPSWGEIHLGPDNALVAHRMLGGRALMPVHWGTFDLGLHPWDEPADVLVQGAEAARVALVTPRLGRPVEPARVERPDPWWREVAAARGATTLSSSTPARAAS